MNSNWAKAARSTTKYQLVLMLTLVGSSVTPSPAQAGLDEKSEVLAEWLVDVTICSHRISPRLLSGQTRQSVFRGRAGCPLLNPPDTYY
jgi:hypothetical protein